MSFKNLLSFRKIIRLGSDAKSMSMLSLHPCKSSVSPPQARNFAIYKPEEYLQSIVDPSHLNEIISDEEEKSKLQFCNVHPTPSSQTISFFNNPKVVTLCNYIMKGGNRVLARNLLEEAFMRVKKTQLKAYHTALTDEERATIECDPMKVYLTALENCRPQLDLMAIKRGGITYQVPVPMSEKHSYFVANRWLIHAGRDRPHRRVHFPENFAKELIDANYNRGRVVQQKIDLHKKCEDNRAYAHYRWS